MVIEMMCEKTENPLNVLYIQRSWNWDWTRDALKKQFIAWRYRNWFHGQEGFFEAGLCSGCRVDSRPLSWVLRNKDKVKSQYDAMVVNSKCTQGGITNIGSQMPWIDELSLPKVLFLVEAQAHIVPADVVLGKFDLVYKREMLRDLSTYPVSQNNVSKLRNTMLSCPIVPLHHSLKNRIAVFPEPRQAGESYEHDVFFSGALRTNPYRQVVLERLQKESIDCFGGLQTCGKVPCRLKNKPLKQRHHYMRAIRRSRINLALEGFGQFTYRHLEIWCLGGFCLSTPSIRDITLPLANPIEGVHYVAFDNLDDMVEKIRYFLTHDKEREAIAAAGRALFEQIYNPIKHGEMIKRELECLVHGFKKR